MLTPTLHAPTLIQISETTLKSNSILTRGGSGQVCWRSGPGPVRGNHGKKSEGGQVWLWHQLLVDLGQITVSWASTTSSALEERVEMKACTGPSVHDIPELSIVWRTGGRLSVFLNRWLFEGEGGW